MPMALVGEFLGMSQPSLQSFFEPREKLNLTHIMVSGFGAVRYMRKSGPKGFEEIVVLMESDAEFCAQIRERFAYLFSHASGLLLLTETGIPGDRGFLGDVINCFMEKLLPKPRTPEDLADVLSGCMPSLQEARWLASQPKSLLERFVVALKQSEKDRRDIWRPLRSEICDAVELLALRVSTVGLSHDIRKHAKSRHIQDSPFYRLYLICKELVTSLREGQTHVTDDRLNACIQEAQACRTTLKRVTESLDNTGVSVDVVFRVELISKSLDRMGDLLTLLRLSRDGRAAVPAFTFTASLVLRRLQDKSLSYLLKNNLNMLARKITEHASSTGEHYITSGWGEYRQMLLTAMGAGVLTAGTCFMKFKIGDIGAAPLVEGVLIGTNYALSFLLLQILGFTLATKQPSMTAASLAHALSRDTPPKVTQRMVELVAKISRSQFVAAVGNVSAVVPAAVLLDLVILKRTGAHMIDAEKARYILQTTDVFAPTTFLFAAMTAVLLWVSSLCSGWLENWSIYRRIPRAIEEHQLGDYLGHGLMKWIAGVWKRNVLGIGANISLGYLLVVPMTLGKLIGVSIDVRHVTLGAGSLAIALTTLAPVEDIWRNPNVYRSIAGIILIGFSNVLVSFVLALMLALRARDAEIKSAWNVLGRILQQALRYPRFFLFPAKSKSRS